MNNLPPLTGTPDDIARATLRRQAFIDKYMQPLEHPLYQRMTEDVLAHFLAKYTEASWWLGDLS